MKHPCHRCGRRTRRPAFCCPLCSIITKGWADRFRRKRTESPRYQLAVENRARTMCPLPLEHPPEKVWAMVEWLSRLHEIPIDDLVLRIARDWLRERIEAPD